MASMEQFKIGVELKEPNWPALCFGLLGPSMRALGYLEAGKPELAIEALKKVQALSEMAMCFECKPTSNAEYRSPYLQEDGTYLAKD